MPAKTRAAKPLKFSAKAKEQLGHYVYLYIDPRTNKPFYIGKGKGNRCFAHLKARRTSEKSRIIRQLAKLGQQPRIEVLKWGLTEDESFLVEQTAIDLLDITNLTNLSRGKWSRIGPRGEVSLIASQLNAKPVKIRDRVILINISRAYRPTMDIQAIYDATRSAWKLGPKRERAQYALAVYRGVVREVFEIAGWVKGGSTMRAHDADGRSPRRSDRYEFVGQVAEDRIRKRYRNRSVVDYFKKGAQNPIKYIRCSKTSAMARPSRA